MTVVPRGIKRRIENAEYYLLCADRFPPPSNNAAHILMLIIASENISLAREELHKWIDKMPVDPKWYRNHEQKLVDAGTIDHVILDPKPTRTVTYSTPSELKKLREYC